MLKSTTSKKADLIALELESYGGEIEIVNEPDFFGFTLEVLSAMPIRRSNSWSISLRIPTSIRLKWDGSAMLFSVARPRRKPMNGLGPSN
jgi:hypothetical protein